MLADLPLPLAASSAGRGDSGPKEPFAVSAVETEVLRTVIVASAFAWIAGQDGDLDVSHGLLFALVLWVGFPLVLLTGSVIWEHVHPATAAVHTGDWLIKLLLIAVILGLVH